MAKKKFSPVVPFVPVEVTPTAPPPPTPDTCERCRYWDRSLCRRFPPAIFLGMTVTPQGPLGMWPVTSPSGWCGEFSPLTTPAPPTTLQ